VVTIFLIKLTKDIKKEKVKEKD
jgi:hypothetical protein